MSDQLAKGRALIDHLSCGISLEIGPHDRKENIEEISKVIENLLEGKNRNEDLDTFEIFDILKGEKGAKLLMENFKEVKKGDLIAEGKEKYFAESDFVPIFVGENSYKGILCLAAKKV